MLSAAGPANPGRGVKRIPSRLALMSPIVAVNDIAASAEPSPAPNVKPDVRDSVSVPLVAASDTRIGLGPASTSETETRLPAAPENSSGRKLEVPCGPGTALTGGSLRAITRNPTTPETRFTPSDAWNVKLSDPLKSG